MKTTWSEFAEAVAAAGLRAKRCPAGGCDHWQITGGPVLVNVWPDTKQGFRMAADNGFGRPGSVTKAIQLAGPPRVPGPQTKHEYPAHLPDVPPFEDRPVGLIRRLWRRFW